MNDLCTLKQMSHFSTNFRTLKYIVISTIALIVKNEIRGGELGLVRFRLAVGVGLVRCRHAVELDIGMKLNMFINSLRYYQHKAFSAREHSFFEGILV